MTMTRVVPGHLIGRRPAPPPAMRKDRGGQTPSSRRKAKDKGDRLQRLARDWYRQGGCKVESAPNVVRWLPVDMEDPRKGRKPVSLRHDFFHIWDLIVVSRGQRFFVQVTTLEGVSARRAKIYAEGFPSTADDRILAHEHGRRWRELLGPHYEMPGRAIEVVIERDKPRRRTDGPELF